MQRTHKAWMLATAVLLSCVLTTVADAQSNSGRSSGKRKLSTAPKSSAATSQRDLFEVSENRRSVRQASHQGPAGTPAPAGQEAMGGEMISPGQQMMGPEAEWSEGPQMGYGPGYDSYGHGDCGCGGAGCSEYGCGSGCNSYGCGNTCGYFRWWNNLSVFSGVQGFRGPVDFGVNSNFGFNEGLNFSTGLFPQHCIGAQVGFRATQTNRDGNPLTGEDAHRDQAFLTAGLFRRSGWLRGGAVIDILNDDYYGDFDLNQIRAELSTMLSRGGEFGVWTAVSSDSDESYLENAQFSTIWSPIDQYAFFYRRETCNGGSYRMWAGFTGHSDAIFGGEFLMPFSNRLAMDASFNYLIPDESGLNSYEQESWNIGINFVWYPGGRSTCGDCGAGALYDPMFRVADNGTFFINRRNVQAMNNNLN